MTTTTIRLSEELKARMAAAAKCSGTTTHGFILEAIAENTQQAEFMADFDAVAEQRYANIVSCGKTIPWGEMRKFLVARVAGKPAKRHPAANGKRELVIGRGSGGYLALYPYGYYCVAVIQNRCCTGPYNKARQNYCLRNFKNSLSRRMAPIELR